MKGRLASAIHDWYKAYANDSCVLKYPDLHNVLVNTNMALTKVLQDFNAAVDSANTKDTKSSSTSANSLPSVPMQGGSSAVKKGGAAKKKGGSVKKTKRLRARG